MKKLDKGVAATVVVLVACVCVKAALEVAASALVPVLIASAGYLVFRLWQTGKLDWLKGKKGTETQPRPFEK